jgi:hypothetical protein
MIVILSMTWDTSSPFIMISNFENILTIIKPKFRIHSKRYFDFRYIMKNYFILDKNGDQIKIS